MRFVRMLVLLVVVIAAAAVGYYAYTQYSAGQAAASAAAAQSRIQYVQVARGTLIAAVSTTGSVTPVSQVRVSFRTAGTLREVNAKVGDAVKAGDVLARLDSTDLELTLATALTNLESAQIRYKQSAAGPKSEDLAIAKSNLDKSFANLQKAQTDYDRIAWQAGSGATTQAVALQQATLDYQIAQANYAKTTAGSTELDLALLQASIKTSQIQVETAKRNLGFAALVAPMDGVVASMGANVGEQVGANAIMFNIVSLKNLRVDATVDETDVAKLVVGQPVSITFDALSDVTLQGKVSAIAPNATMQSGVVTYLVQVTVIGNDPRLLAGLTATASIVVERRDNVLMVPNRAIRVARNVRSVQVAENGGGLVTKQITTGMSNEQFTEVTSGINEGDQVAIVTTATNQPLAGGTMFGGGGSMFGGGMPGGSVPAVK